MVLYALCLHSLFCALAENLQGPQITRRTWCVPVVAYADDVTVFVTDPDDFTIVH